MTSEMLVTGEHCQQGKDSFLPKTTTPQAGGQGQQTLHKVGLNICDQNCGPVQKRLRSDHSMLGFLEQHDWPQKVPRRGSNTQWPEPDFQIHSMRPALPDTKASQRPYGKLKPISLMNTDINILKLNTSKLNPIAY